MKSRSGLRAGFTMVELLTVIAIIAILVAILMPVFATVRNTMREGQCMSNLHNIGVARDLYHDSWDKSPIVLDAFVAGGVTFRGMPVEIKSDANFRCPMNIYPATDQNVQVFQPAQLTAAGAAMKRFPGPPAGAPVQLCVSGVRWAIRQTCRATETAVPVQFLLRDSYDGGQYPRSQGSPYELHYSLDWTEQIPSPADNPRQMKYRKPPPDTVVTYCLNHTSLDAQGVPQGNVLTLFFDGRVQKIPGTRFNPALGGQDGNTWLVRPK